MVAAKAISVVEQVDENGVLDLCKQGLGPEGAAAVMEQVIDAPTVEHILLGTNGLGAEGIKIVADSLRNDHRLQTLYFGCNGIDAGAVQPLTSALTTDQTVQSLWLKRNPLGPEGAALVADVVRRNSHLRTLDLVATGLTIESVEKLRDATRANPATRLNRLHIGGNQLDGSASTTIVELVAAAPNLLHLSLALNPIGDDGLHTLVEGLESLGRPLRLGLSDCGLTSEAAADLARAGTWAYGLDLAPRNDWHDSGAITNSVGDTTAVEFAQLISSGSCSLRSLKLAGNGITSRGAHDLARAVESHNHSLHTLIVGKGTARSLRRRITSALHPVTDSVDPDIAAIRSQHR